MADDCDPLIPDDLVFPRRPLNRPALSRIAYRSGAYPDMVAAMMRAVDSEVALSAWTHRGADDPAIALLESAGLVGDILTFYQERYANQAFHRTATWHESVTELVRLLGYRLTPGLGGHASLAVEVKGDRPVTIPAGHPFKTDLEGRDTPAEFQTDTALEAHSVLSNFNLYRSRSYATFISANIDTMEIDSVGGSGGQDAIAALDLKAGDRLLLLPAAPDWVTLANQTFGAQASHQVLEVKEVEIVLGRWIVTFKTPLAHGWDSPIEAYRLGRSWRHFGHASPATYTRPVTDSSGNVTGSREYDTGFLRHLHENHPCANTSTSINLPGKDIPLDTDVGDILRGSYVAVELRVQRDSQTRPLIVRRKVVSTRATSLAFGNQTAATTILRLNNGILNRSASDGDEADIRDYRIHEITSGTVRLRGKATAQGGAFTTSTDALAFYGLQKDVRKLAGRKISLLHDDGRTGELTCIDAPEHFNGGGSEPKMWPLSFDARPDPFLRSDFDETTPKVTVFGNVVRGSEGKALEVLTLGDGDKRQVFQTFALPKPVTHHLSLAADPAEVPELTVYVDGRAATLVNSHFGQPNDALVYILRSDADGKFYVQFGDGQTGSRLPSGSGNITATMRTGSGARGALPDGATPSAPRIDGVTKLHIPAGVTGGADPETSDNAKLAAPGKVQGLGRIVSLKDYETELLAIPGVTRVRASWDMADGTPAVVLAVLLESGREAEYDAVRDAVQGFQQCRGSNRFAISVQQARLRQIYLDLTYQPNPGLIAANVEAAATAALSPIDSETGQPGLFTKTARQIGGAEYATRVEGCVQALPQINYGRVTGFGLLPITPDGDGPDSLYLPAAPRLLNPKITPASHELLQLHSAHLTLTQAAADPVEDCA